MCQTYTNFELICVNDASTDNSVTVLKELQKQDSRIIILDRAVNSGAAASRNCGLEEARGEYVIFLDSDDYFYPEMLETAYGQAVQYNADIVIFGSETVIKNTQEVKVTGYPFEVIDNNEQKALFLPKLRHVPWDKLVRRKLVLENGIVFQDILTNNDVFYSFSTVLTAGKIVVCDKILLRYCDGRQGSLTNIRFSKKNCTVEAFNAIFNFCIQKDIEECLQKAFINMLTDNLQCYLMDRAYPLTIRQGSLNILSGCGDLIKELERRLQDDSLYPHNHMFVRRLISGKEICQMEYTRHSPERLEEIIAKSRNLHKKIALWGCGKNGKCLLDIMQAHHLEIDYIVDENKELQGKSYGQYIIRPYDEVSEDIDIVWYTNRVFKNAIQARVRDKELVYVWH